jgi:peptide-methionine (R)-S-oxide reductase
MAEPESLTEDQWRERLTPEQFEVLRKKGTERAFTGKYWDEKTQGIYKCAGCGEPLFASDVKFDSGSGWPSFFRPLEESKVEEIVDRSHGMARTEVTCKKCGAHLGHVFDDGPAPTGLRYCINSVSLDLDPSRE